MTAQHEPVRSWVGIVIGVLVAIPAVSRIAAGSGTLVLNFVLLLFALVLLVPSALLRIEIDGEIIRVWPFRTTVRLENIDWVEPKGSFFASLAAHRVDVPRPTPLTVHPIGPGRARAVADSLNTAVQLAKRAS